MPAVSILMSVYNNGPYVAQAVRSVLSQTIQDFEFFIADDASTDGSWEKLQSLARQDARIRLWRHATNRGKCANLNEMFDSCDSEYIAFMDGDDVAFPTRLESELAVLTSSDIDICGSGFINFGMGAPVPVYMPTTDSDIRASLLFDCSLAHPTVVVKRRIVEQVKLRSDMVPAADYDYWVRAARIGKMQNIPKILLGRRLHSGQISARRHADQVAARRRTSLLAISDIGLRPDATEYRLHLRLFGVEKHIHSTEIPPAEIPTATELEAMGCWVEQLAGAFEKYGYSKSFLAQLWYRVSQETAPCGPVVYRTYLKHARAANFDVPPDWRYIIHLLSTLHMQYRSRLFKCLSALRKKYRINQNIQNTALQTAMKTLQGVLAHTED